MSKFHSKENIHPYELVLKVGDMERAVYFYEELLGFKVISREEKEIVLTADGSSPIITLTQPENPIEKLPRRTGLYHFALLLPDNFQLGLFLKHLRKQSYPIIGASHHRVSEAVYLEDPDGNGIEVYADINSDHWKWVGESVDMTTLPLDINKLMDETEGYNWQGIPSNTIIGHIHLHVADLESAKCFYVEGIGLDIVAEIPGSAIFLSSGGYHHHIAFNIWNGRGAEALPENSVGMKYYTINFPDEIARANRLRELGSLGYNYFKENGDIFVKDPSSNLIRLVV